MRIDTATVAALISGGLSPFVIAVLVKLHASDTLKRNVAFGFALLAGVLPTVAFDAETGWRGYVLNVALALVTQQSIHRTGATKTLAEKTATVGVGDPTPADLIIPPPGNPGDVGDTSDAGARIA